MKTRSLVWLSLAALYGRPATAGDMRPPVEVSSVADRALAARPGESLFLAVGDRITTARVDRGGMSSRGISLRFAANKLHGQIGGQQVELEMQGARITGRIGTRDIVLDVGRSEGALTVRGKFGARAVSEDLAPTGLTAEIGPCRYDLKFQHMEYSGQVGCGAQPEAVHLRVPAALVARADMEIAALITAFLSR